MAKFDKEWEEFYALKVTPQQMDLLLADGWRHFGDMFFRYPWSWHEGNFCTVLPLRINTEAFFLRKSQRKIMRVAQDAGVKVIYREAFIDDEKEEIFYQHSQRFKSNIPDNIYTFLHEKPAKIPCKTMECALYDKEDKLYAVSFFDESKNSVSSVYAMFRPEYERLSPGTHTLLCEILYAIENEKKYVYTGYCYDVPSHYDYKKNFHGTEFFDWERTWATLEIAGK